MRSLPTPQSAELPPLASSSESSESKAPTPLTLISLLAASLSPPSIHSPSSTKLFSLLVLRSTLLPNLSLTPPMFPVLFASPLPLLKSYLPPSGVLHARSALIPPPES